MSNIILYETTEGKVKVDVHFEHENFWLNQKAMATLFNCSTDNISLHLKNIFKEELSADSVTEEFSATAADGKKYKTKSYNLDAVIAVGYRVKSKKEMKKAKIYYHDIGDYEGQDKTMTLGDVNCSPCSCLSADRVEKQKY